MFLIILFLFYYYFFYLVFILLKFFQFYIPSHFYFNFLFHSVNFINYFIKIDFNSNYFSELLFVCIIRYYCNIIRKEITLRCWPKRNVSAGEINSVCLGANIVFGVEMQWLQWMESLCYSELNFVLMLQLLSKVIW